MIYRMKCILASLSGALGAGYLMAPVVLPGLWPDFAIDLLGPLGPGTAFLLAWGLAVLSRFSDAASTVLALESSCLEEGAPGLGPRPTPRRLYAITTGQAVFLSLCALLLYAVWPPVAVFYCLWTAIGSFAAALSNLWLVLFVRLLQPHGRPSLAQFLLFSVLRTVGPNLVSALLGIASSLACVLALLHPALRPHFAVLLCLAGLGALGASLLTPGTPFLRHDPHRARFAGGLLLLTPLPLWPAMAAFPLPALLLVGLSRLAGAAWRVAVRQQRKIVLAHQLLWRLALATHVLASVSPEAFTKYLSKQSSRSRT
jgi:hypothetical protein